MKKTILTLLAGIAAVSALSGCSFITSHQPSSTAVTGEAWYVKTRFFIIPYSKEVYYCDGKGTCKEATMKD